MTSQLLKRRLLTVATSHWARSSQPLSASALRSTAISENACQSWFGSTARSFSSEAADESAEGEAEEVEEDPEVVLAREREEAKQAKEAIAKTLAAERLHFNAYESEIRQLRKQFVSEVKPKETVETVVEEEKIDKSLRRKVERVRKRLPHLSTSQLLTLATPPSIQIKYSKAPPKNSSSKQSKDRSGEAEIEFKSALSDLTTLTPSEEWVIDSVEFEEMLDKSLDVVVPVTEGFRESLPKKLAPLSPLFLLPTDFRYGNDPQSMFESYTLIIKDNDDEEDFLEDIENTAQEDVSNKEVSM